MSRELVEALSRGATPAGPVQPLGFRKGQIMSFDQVTYENEVQVDGQVFPNLDIWGVADVAEYVPGTVVGLVTVGGSWAIAGRFVTPPL